MSTEWKVFHGDGRETKAQFPPAPPWRVLEKSSAHRARTYRPSEPEVDMVNAAIHLQRPLLVEGPPGSGKSSLIHAVAHELKLGPVLHWPINSRSTLREGLYKYDAVGRINDRSRPSAKSPNGADPPADEDIGAYIVLGPLGTALLPSERPRALLIDEIDKSDIDLPNDLLHVLEHGWFEIPELVRVVGQKDLFDVRTHPEEGEKGYKTATIDRGTVRATAFPFVLITSNGERELPPAFLRRCVRYTIQMPDEDRLVRIVRAHLGEIIEQDEVRSTIGEFLNDVKEGRQLAIDQLLNAVFLLSETQRPSGEEWLSVKQAVLRGLSEG
jgi:MoxR-like ATPase